MNSNFRGRDFCIQQVNEAKFKHFERYYAAPENDRGLNLFFGIVFASQNICQKMMWSGINILPFSQIIIGEKLLEKWSVGKVLRNFIRTLDPFLAPSS